MLSIRTIIYFLTLFLAYYTTIAFKSYIPLTFSLRMFFVTCFIDFDDMSSISHSPDLIIQLPKYTIDYLITEGTLPSILSHAWSKKKKEEFSRTGNEDGEDPFFSMTAWLCYIKKLQSIVRSGDIGSFARNFHIGFDYPVTELSSSSLTTHNSG